VPDLAAILRQRRIQPSAQRMAIAAYVLDTEDHPSADQVFVKVRRKQPTISRATVYNTLNRFVREGLLRTLVLAEGRVVFDPNVRAHHHFVDEATGRIHDVPWDALGVSRVDTLVGLDVREYQVILRGRRKTRRA
jgi:Fe2+ or Zn2+ uptake regulation protein